MLKLMSFFSKLTLTYILSFSMVFMPVARAQDGKQGQEYVAKVKETAGQYNANALNVLLMMVIAIVAVQKPIPKIYQPAKEDCPTNFAGPVTVGMVKAGLLAMLIAEIQAYIRYKQAGDKLNEADQKLAGKSDLNEGDKQIASFDAVIEYLKSQKGVAETKIAINAVAEAIFLSAMGIEIGNMITCKAKCSFDYPTVKGRFDTIVARINSFNIQIQTAAAGAGPVAALFTPYLTQSAQITGTNVAELTAGITQAAINETKESVQHARDQGETLEALKQCTQNELSAASSVAESVSKKIMDTTVSEANSKGNKAKKISTTARYGSDLARLNTTATTIAPSATTLAGAQTACPGPCLAQAPALTATAIQAMSQSILAHTDLAQLLETSNITCCGGYGGNTPNTFATMPPKPPGIFEKIRDLEAPKKGTGGGFLKGIVFDSNKNWEKNFNYAKDNLRHQQAVVAQLKNSHNFGQAYFMFKEWERFSQGEKQSEKIDQYYAQLEELKKNGLDVKLESNVWGLTFSQMVNYMNPLAIDNVEAMDFMGLLGIAAGGALMLKKVFSTVYDWGTKAPLNRTIFWGVLSALGGATIGSLAGDIDEINRRIKFLEDEKKKLKSKGNSDNGLATGDNPQGNRPNIILGKLTGVKDPNGGAVNGCVRPSSAGEYEAVDCAVCHDGKCKLEIPKTLNLPGMNMGAYTNSMQYANQQTNAIAAGNFNSGSFNGGSLGSNALREQNKKMKKDLDDLMKKNGQNPHDIDKSANEFISAMRAAVQKAMQASGKNVAAGSAPSSSVGTDNSNAPAAKTTVDVPTGVGTTESSAGASAPVSDTPLDLGLGGETQGVTDTVMESGEEVKAGLDSFEVQEGDIHKSPETSLFDIIHGRYLRSYGKVLEEGPVKKK